MNLWINDPGRVILASFNFPNTGAIGLPDWMDMNDGFGLTPVVVAPDVLEAYFDCGDPCIGPGSYYGTDAVTWTGAAPSDQWISLVYKGESSTGGEPIMLFVRMTCTVVDCNGYEFAVVSTTGEWYLNDFSGTANPLAVGDTLRLEAQGSTIRAYQNDVVIAEMTDQQSNSGELGFRLGMWGNQPISYIDVGDVKLGTFGELASISQDNYLWYFGPGNVPPASFNLGKTTTTLSANGAANGTYVWTVTSPGNKLLFENGSTTITKTDINTVGIQASGFSDQANDITVTLEYTPAGGTTITLNYALTIDSPYQLVSNGSPSHAAVGGMDCNANPMPDGTLGFQTLIPYNMMSRFGKLITNIDMNESFGTWSTDYIGNTWVAPLPGSFTSDNGFFVDHMCVQGWFPPAMIPQSPLSTTGIQHATQSWFVGSLTSGSGVQVQTNTHQRFIDHGEHTSITSPVR